MTNNRLLENVRQLLHERAMLPPHAHLMVALSGGADSVALLYAMHRLREELAIDRLAAVHIHHGLRGEEADRDEAIAAAHCARCEIPLFTRHVDVAAVAEDIGCGLEEAGRKVRYRVFNELLDTEGYTHLATAHTQNDNTETVLLHLARGTSVAGLRGIPAVRDRYIRPLLTTTREDVETFCEENMLTFGLDSTNTDTAFARNRVRNCIVPHLYTINPRIHQSIFRLSVMAGEDEAYWQETVTAAIDECEISQGVYSAATLQRMPPALQRRVIQRIITLGGGICEERHIREVTALLLKSGAVKTGGGVLVTVKQGYLTVGESASYSVAEQPLSAGKTYRFGNTAYRAEVWDRNTFENYQKIHKILLQYVCDYDKIKGVACVRSRREGDICTPYHRGGRRTLKKWFNTEKVPAARRDTIPVVADADGVVLVVGLGCDARVALDDTTQHILLFFEIDEGSEMYA
ncbi:MAG: tRNA lysidine(34) synthetase TilS [Ruminococcaceae bacterium]|nr:tRNA lysidine(34) synthetase TilS [Oscillospiraceae bacterium]